MSNFPVLLKLICLFRTLRLKFYPCFNRLIFYLNGITLGHNMKVFNKIYVMNKGVVTIGNNFNFSSGEMINPLARNIRGSIYVQTGGELFIGNNVGISSAVLWVCNHLSIGDNVKIGALTVIIDNDAHSLDYRERNSQPEIKTGVKSAPIIIEEDVLIGSCCVILKGVTIGARSVIGAGSVVTHDIPADVIAAGNPCKVIRKIELSN